MSWMTDELIYEAPLERIRKSYEMEPLCDCSEAVEAYTGKKLKGGGTRVLPQVPTDLRLGTTDVCTHCGHHVFWGKFNGKNTQYG